MSYIFKKAAVLSIVVLSFSALGLLALPDDSSTFVGGKKCKKCHIKQHKTWADTKHANSFHCIEGDDMKKPDCIRCHTTGYGMGGFVSMEETPHLVNIQCEQCHGKGSEHVTVMTKLRKEKVDKAEYPEDKLINRKPSGCSECHNPHKKHAKIEKK